MPVLLIISDRPGVGKTAMAGAVAAELLDRGERVAYIKPFSVGPGPDPDVVYLNELLLSNGTATTPAARPYDGGNLQSSQMQNIGPAIEQLSAEGQFVLIEGPSLSSLEADQAALLASSVRGVDGKVLLVYGFQHSIDGLSVQQKRDAFGEQLAGVVVNMVPKYRLRQLIENPASGPYAETANFLGAIPADRTMASVTVGRIAELLNGRWISGEEGADELIENLLIGGNIMDNGETYFGRHKNQAVMVRGDRTDIHLACLKTGTTCLMLTGGFTPNQYVRHEAEQQDVPLFVLEGSTIACAEALDEVLSTPLVHHPAKIQCFRELLGMNVDMGFLSKMLEGADVKRG